MKMEGRARIFSVIGKRFVSLFCVLTMMLAMLPGSAFQYVFAESTEGSAVQVTVTNVEGEAISGAEITLTDETRQYSASTDEKGIASMEMVAAGVYEVVVLAKGYEAYVSSITIAEDEAEKEMQMELLVENLNIKTSVSDGCTVNIPSLVSYGSDVEMFFTMEDGYELEKILVNGQDMKQFVQERKLILHHVEEDQDIQVSCIRKSYTVRLMVGNNGVATSGNETLGGNVTVFHGEHFVFQAKANMGYHVDSVKTDGVYILQKGEDSKTVYEGNIADVQESHVVEIAFAPNTCRMQVSIENNTKSGIVEIIRSGEKVQAGDVLEFLFHEGLELSVVPEEGYQAKVSVVDESGNEIEGVDVSNAGAEYRISNVSKDSIVKVTLSAITYTVMGYNPLGENIKKEFTVESKTGAISLGTPKQAEGYRFLGWYQEENGKVDAGCTRVEEVSCAKLQDTDLYAVWKIEAIHVSAKGYKNGEEVSGQLSGQWFDGSKGVWIECSSAADDIVYSYKLDNREEKMSGNSFFIDECGYANVSSTYEIRAVNEGAVNGIDYTYALQTPLKFTVNQDRSNPAVEIKQDVIWSNSSHHGNLDRTENTEDLYFITASDGGSGICKVEYQYVPYGVVCSMDESALVSYLEIQEWELLADSGVDKQELCFSEAGEWVLVVKATDFVGRVHYSDSTGVLFDSGKPEIKVTYNKKPNNADNYYGNDSITASIQITDDALVFSTEEVYSGYEVSVNGKNVTDSIKDGELKKLENGYIWQGTYTFDIKEYADIGRQILTVTAIDKCGNSADEYRSKSIYIGKGKPEISVVYEFKNGADSVTQSNPGNIYSNDVIKAYITIQDADLIDEKAEAYENYKVKISGKEQEILDGSVTYDDGKKTYVWTGTALLEKETYAEKGEQILSVAAADESGNEAEEYVSESLYIDTKAPVVSVAYQYSQVDEGMLLTAASTEPNTFEYSSGDITADITIEDDGLDWAVNGFLSRFTVDIAGKEILPEDISWEDGGKIWRGRYTFDANSYGDIAPFQMSVLAYDECGNSTTYYSGKMAVDTVPGTITRAELTLKNTSLPAKFMNFLTFGTFFGQKAMLEVMYDDINEDHVEGSGVERISLYWGEHDKAYLAADVDYEEKSGVYTFECPKGMERKDGILALSVTDFTGNISEKIELERVSETAKNSYVMYEAIHPSVSADYESKTVKDQDDSRWVEKGEDIVITVKDVDSGLNTVTILNNQKAVAANPQADSKGTYYYGDLEARINMVSYTIRYDDLYEGKNDFQVTVMDNCGNELIQAYDFTVYKDTSTPKISSLTLDGEGWNNRYQDLKFGNYFNKDVEVTVESTDGIEEMCSSGLYSVRLLFGGKSYPMELDSKDSNKMGGVARKAVFTIPVPQEPVESELQIVLTDHVGNTITYGKDENQNAITEDFGKTNMKKGVNVLMIERKSPVVQSVKPMKPAYKDKDGNWWYNTKDVKYTIQILDRHSGIRNVKVNLNGKDIKSWNFWAEEKKVTKKTLKFTLDDSKAVKVGKNIVVISVTDNAGNIISSKESVVYLDLGNPEVIGFRYNLKEYTDGYTNKVTKYGNYENIADTVVTTDYGYYFKEDVEVTVIAGDASYSSGIDKIYFRAVDINGKVIVDAISKKAGVDAKTEGHTTSSATFTVPANFKGQIFAYAQDHVGNYPHNRSTGKKKYKSPNDTIVEDKERHLATSEIMIQKPDAPSHTVDGQDLYAGNVDVSFQVVDTYSGIRTIEWKVESLDDTQNNQSGIVEIGNDGMLTGDVSNWSKDSKDGNLVTKMSNSIVVRNNSNQIKVTLKMTDRAGNSSEEDISFSIDKTPPKIEVTYNNNNPDAANSEYFKNDRVATVTITERNFNADDVDMLIHNSLRSIPGISGWTRHSLADHPTDLDTYTAAITFHDDGDYNFQMGFRDLAGNEAASYEDHFTMDETLPAITVELDNKDVSNRNYYKEEQVAVITIVEHNFDPSRIKITGSGDDDGNAVAYPSLGEWISNGDTHKASITYASDGFYTLDVAVADMAGNDAEPPETISFYVDQSEPEIEFLDVEDNMAYSDEIVPKIRFHDTNYADYDVKLTRTVLDNQDVDVRDQFVKAFDIHKQGGSGQIESLEKKQENDGIYTLTAYVKDLAGNEKTKSITFSVNRFGSVYVYSDDLKDVMGGYHKSVEGDLYIMAYNADRLMEANLDIARDGSSICEGAPELKSDQKTGTSGWYEYMFAIDNDDLKKEGRYEVSLMDKDAAKNTRTNSDKSIWFYVDENPPVFDSVVGLELSSVNKNELPVEYIVSDAIALKEVRVYINDNQVEKVSKFDSPQDYKGKFIVPSGFRQKIRIEADDMVGTTTVFDKEVTISKNPFVRWYAHTILFWGTWVAFVIAAATVLSLFVVKRRKAEENEKEG